MRKSTIILLSLLVLTACQSAPRNWEPIIDRQGVDMNRYVADLAECRSYADSIDPAERAAVAAAGGAAVGAVVGVVAGDNRESAARGAAIGAVAGGVRGARQARQEINMIVRNCLTGRGYRVLN
jgi:outer membrane lipoprotein SlyB